MTDFPSILKAKIAEKGLNAADAAAAIGVSAPSLRTALSGASFPNARSLSKYSSFLGLSDADTKALIDAAKPAAGSKAGKKPGRKPGKAAGEKGSKAVKADKTVKVKGKAGRKAKASSSASSALEAISSALKQADSLMGDSLAVAVNKLGAGPRKIIEAIVKSLS